MGDDDVEGGGGGQGSTLISSPFEVIYESSIELCYLLKLPALAV